MIRRLRRFLVNYHRRHRHPANLALHVIGLPVTFYLPIVLLIHERPLWAGAAFVGGYALQFLGHAVEGNDPGEVVLIKKLLGRPYVDVAPRRNGSKSDG